MAHFAQLDDNNVVTQVVVVSNAECVDANGLESEIVGAGFCTRLLGGKWKQTSYNANFRKNFAGIGFTYDSQRDAFIPPKPYPSWTLDEDTCRWVSPSPCPSDGKLYTWDEQNTEWLAAHEQV